jgi:hypothetical protein
MTWKRELAFWAFMFLVGIWFLYALVNLGIFLTEKQVAFSGVIL